MGSARGVMTRACASVACAVLMAAGVPTVARGVQPPPVEPSLESGSMLGSLSLIPWFAAPSLVTLRKEVDARWPGRSRSSDGVIGDTRHAARTNSHNPVGAGNGPGVGTRGAVHAIDITSAGIDVAAFLSAVVGDPRVWYVIHDGQIWSRTTGWAPIAHRGDPHTTHIHVNLREDSQGAAVAAENDTRSWFGTRSGISPAFLQRPSAASTLTPEQTTRLQTGADQQGVLDPGRSDRQVRRPDDSRGRCLPAGPGLERVAGRWDRRARDAAPAGRQWTQRCVRRPWGVSGCASRQVAQAEHTGGLRHP